VSETLTQPLDRLMENGGWTVGEIYAAHADFAWRALHRLGVRPQDLEDSTQEVFMVVHRRLDSFDGSARMTTWLFGICMRVAAGYRRKAFRRYETVYDDVPEARAAEPALTPEDLAARSQARVDLGEILDAMPLERRAAFAMFELDGLPCDEIARLMDVPVGTIHSRLHAARREFADGLSRLNARRATGGGP